MSEKYTYSKNGVDFIMHSKDRASHKWLYKVNVGNNKERYFYSEAEYQAYTKSKQGLEDIANGAQTVANEAYDTNKQAADMATNFVKNSNEMAKNAINSEIEKVGKAGLTAYASADKAVKDSQSKVDSVSKSASNLADSVSGTINAGKDFWDSLFK